MNNQSRSEIERALAAKQLPPTMPRPAQQEADNSSPFSNQRAANIIGGNISGLPKKPRAKVGLIWWLTVGLILLIGVVLLIPTPENNDVQAPTVEVSPQALAENPIYTDGRVDEADVSSTGDTSFSSDQDIDRANQFRQTEIDNEKVAQLSEKAKANIRKGEYTEPKGDNALQHYQAILSIDGNNSLARNGIEYISNRFFVLGSKQVEKGQLDNARESLATLFLIDQNSDQYIELTDKITELELSLQLSPEEQKIANLLEKASAAILKERFTTPTKDNALSYYQAVLSLDSNNQTAKQGIATITGRYVLLANESMQNNNIQKAESYAATISAIDPNHPSLALLINRIKKIRNDELLLQQALQQPNLNQTEPSIATTQEPNPAIEPAPESGSVTLVPAVSSDTVNPSENTPASANDSTSSNSVTNPTSNPTTNPTTTASLESPETIPAENSQAIELATESSKELDEVRLQAGLKAYYGGNYPKALTNLLPLADKNIARAQVRVAYMYYLGRGVEPSRNIAEDYLRKAMPAVNSFANENRAWAQSDLGSLFEDGLILKQDYKEAINWYQKAADQNYPGAQTNLGNMYYTGKGVEQDNTKAIEWFRRAANNGDAVGLRNLRALGVSVN